MELTYLEVVLYHFIHGTGGERVLIGYALKYFSLVIFFLRCVIFFALSEN